MTKTSRSGAQLCRVATMFTATALSLIACSPAPSVDASADSALDASADVTPPSDVVVSFPSRPGCNPTMGIECDGHFEGRCEGCAPTQCCVPQNGAFVCADKGADGFCPAPDISVREDQITGRYDVQWRYFDPGDCAIEERCVNGPGWRRLLLFDTVTPNRGTADMYMGAPRERPSFFEYSTCHEHYHFNSYAQYQLRGGDGGLAASGHKQAFCLEDTSQFVNDSPEGIHYTCDNQGIQMGYQDVYGSYLDCQWVDVTDVAQGDYSLNIQINTEHLLNETNYANNEINVPISIGPDDADADPTRPCAHPIEGSNRQCGLTNAGTFTCAPGTMVRTGCSAACMLGSCTGDTVMRVCPGDRPCGPRAALGINDDSGCPARGDGDYCSQVRFTCPAGGRYTVLSGSIYSDEPATCTVQSEPMSAPSTDAGVPADAAPDAGADASSSDASSGD